MAKNSQLHLFIETEALDTLRRESTDLGVSLSELCRQKLRKPSYLTRIETLIDKLEYKTCTVPKNI
jgi:hypothetical protein